MFIRSQDKQTLINTDNVSSISIHDTINNTKSLTATLDPVYGEIVLGEFETQNQAADALEFLQLCVTDEESQKKMTTVPTLEEMTCTDFTMKDVPGSLDEFFGMLKSMLPNE